MVAGSNPARPTTTFFISALIKNIIFDLGGVIIDIFPERSVAAFAPYLNGLAEQNVYRHRLFHDLETGQITPVDFRNQLRAELNSKISDAEIDRCMIAMLGDIPSSRIRLLEKMKGQYLTLLLSNTNAIHYDACTRYLQGTFGPASFDSYFHKTYYSHIVGLRKPDPRLFERVINENNLVPEETLYLDDMGENLKSARTLGIQTVKVTAESDILQILKDY